MSEYNRSSILLVNEAMLKKRSLGKAITERITVRDNLHCPIPRKKFKTCFKVVHECQPIKLVHLLCWNDFERCIRDLFILPGENEIGQEITGVLGQKKKHIFAIEDGDNDTTDMVVENERGPSIVLSELCLPFGLYIGGKPWRLTIAGSYVNVRWTKQGRACRGHKYALGQGSPWEG